jgi:hypothetical protein
VFDEAEEVPEGEPDAEGDEHLAGAQAMSASVLFYELLVSILSPAQIGARPQSPGDQVGTRGRADHPKTSSIPIQPRPSSANGSLPVTSREPAAITAPARLSGKHPSE